MIKQSVLNNKIFYFALVVKFKDFKKQYVMIWLRIFSFRTYKTQLGDLRKGYSKIWKPISEKAEL